MRVKGPSIVTPPTCSWTIPAHDHTSSHSRADTTHPIRAPPSVSVDAGGAGVGVQARVGKCDEFVWTLRRHLHMLLNHP
jgi:hypothetical protein